MLKLGAEIIYHYNNNNNHNGDVRSGL